MPFYYIIKNKIYTYEEELSKNLYTYEKLTEEQTTFYQHCLETDYIPEISEILQCKKHVLLPPVIELNELRDMKLRDLKSSFQIKLNQGFTFKLNNKEITVDCNEEAIQKQLAGLQIYKDIEDIDLQDIHFRDYYNDCFTVTYPEYNKIIQAVSKHYITLREQYWKLYDKIAEAKTVEDLQNIKGIL
jgi:hypothetical protein